MDESELERQQKLLASLEREEAKILARHERELRDMRREIAIVRMMIRNAERGGRVLA